MCGQLRKDPEVCNAATTSPVTVSEVMNQQYQAILQANRVSHLSNYLKQQLNVLQADRSEQTLPDKMMLEP